MSALALSLFEPGFLHSSPVRSALVLGALAATVSGASGVFVVMRAQAFAGEALGDVGSAGGSAAYLAGVGPWWGFAAFGLLAAGAIELTGGAQRPRGRDLAAGVVLGAGLALAALFLYLDATYKGTGGAAVTVLFGSVFALPGSVLPLAAGLAAAVGLLLCLLRRPLLLATVSPDLAAARGVASRSVGLGFMLALSLSVALCAITVGTILSTALLIGPAAAALRLARRPGLAMLTAGALGTAATWLGILLAYDSYYWPPHGRGWPVSFFIVALALVTYGLSGLIARRS